MKLKFPPFYPLIAIETVNNFAWAGKGFTVTARKPKQQWHKVLIWRKSATGKRIVHFGRDINGPENL